jgi:hypothetical protein
MDFFDKKINTLENKISSMEEKLTFLLSEHYKTLEVFEKQKSINDKLIKIIKENIKPITRL